MQIRLQLFIIVVCKEKTSKRWSTLTVVREVGREFIFVILKNPKIFYLNDFPLIFEMYSINCMAIVSH